MTLQGYEAEAAWIRSRINTLWVIGANPRTPIAWDNVSFAKKNPQAAWIRVSIRHSGAGQAEISTNPMYRHDGVVVVEVFTPGMKGDSESNTLCDHVGAMFRGVTGPGIRFRPPYPIRVGDTDGWFKQDVICPFTRDTIFT